jgi:hypothetical protein
VVNTFLFDLFFFRTNPVRRKSLGADPPSRGYGVAGEAAPSNIVLIIHAMLQAGGTLRRVPNVRGGHTSDFQSALAFFSVSL